MKKKPKWRKVFSRFFFSGEEKKKIIHAIQKAESGTSAEIRVRVEKRNPKLEILKQAQVSFLRLGMHKTALKNGVMILVCPNTHEFAVIGDRGIHEKVTPEFWTEIAHGMAEDFRKHRIVEGLDSAIEKIGIKLKGHFPRAGNDRNELSDRISS